MRTGFVFSSLIASSLAVTELIAENPTPFECFKYGSGDDETSLQVVSSTVYDMETGKNSWRIRFEYKGLIQEDDEVHFYLSFAPTYLLATRDVNVIAEDIGHCSATINEANPIFWTVEALDTYATCTPISDDDVYDCIDRDPERYPATSEATSENNWIVPIEDDDPEDRFCTRPDDYLEDQTYTCKEFKCSIQRLFDTENAKDMIIEEPGEATNTVTVFQNRCWAQIGNSSSFTSAGPKDVDSKTIEITKGAVMGTSASVAAILALTTAMFSF